jgi:hypothetical protein
MERTAGVSARGDHVRLRGVRVQGHHQGELKGNRNILELSSLPSATIRRQGSEGRIPASLSLSTENNKWCIGFDWSLKKEKKWSTEDFLHFLFTLHRSKFSSSKFSSFVIKACRPPWYWSGIRPTSDFKVLNPQHCSLRTGTWCILWYRYLVHYLVPVPGTFFGTGTWYFLWCRYLVHSLIPVPGIFFGTGTWYILWCRYLVHSLVSVPGAFFGIAGTVFF